MCVWQESWPLHAKEVSLVSPNLFVDVNDPIYDYLSMRERYSELRDLPQCSFPVSKLSNEDIRVMTERDLIEPVSTEDIPKGCVGLVFCVAEESKTRRRLVHDTLTPNVELSEDPSVSFTPIPELLKQANRFKYACTFDFSSYYYQFELAPEVRSFFAFKVGDLFYRMKRLPMGFKLACKMAQLASKFLSENPFDVRVEVYIDNIMFLGNDREEVARAREYFLEKCKRYNVTLSEDSGVQTFAVFRGIHFDLSSHTVALKESYPVQFRSLDFSVTQTWAWWRSTIGKVIYALQILQVPLCRIFLLLKLLAKNVLTNPSKKMCVSDAIRKQATSISQVIAKNTPRPVYEENVDTKILITDAALSTQMWGSVLVTQSKVLLASGYLESVESINVAELEAVQKSIVRFNLRVHTLRVLSDNASTIFWLKNGWAPHFYANTILQRIFVHVKRIFPLYVPSGLNPADPLSRNSDLQQVHIDFVEFVRRTGFTVSWGGGGWTPKPLS